VKSENTLEQLKFVHSNMHNFLSFISRRNFPTKENTSPEVESGTVYWMDFFLDD
jgi:hypothetical protein